jgi:hypothetical protein
VVAVDVTAKCSQPGSKDGGCGGWLVLGRGLSIRPRGIDTRDFGTQVTRKLRPVAKTARQMAGKTKPWLRREAQLGLRKDRLNVKVTQHDGNGMYHPVLGGYNPDWVPPGEA